MEQELGDPDIDEDIDPFQARLLVSRSHSLLRDQTPLLNSTALTFVMVPFLTTKSI